MELSIVADITTHLATCKNSLLAIIDYMKGIRYPDLTEIKLTVVEVFKKVEFIAREGNELGYCKGLSLKPLIMEVYSCTTYDDLICFIEKNITSIDFTIESICHQLCSPTCNTPIVVPNCNNCAFIKYDSIFKRGIYSNVIN